MDAVESRESKLAWLIVRRTDCDWNLVYCAISCHALRCGLNDRATYILESRGIVERGHDSELRMED